MLELEQFKYTLNNYYKSVKEIKECLWPWE